MNMDMGEQLIIIIIIIRMTTKFIRSVRFGSLTTKIEPFLASDTCAHSGKEIDERIGTYECAVKTKDIFGLYILIVTAADDVSPHTLNLKVE